MGADPAPAAPDEARGRSKYPHLGIGLADDETALTFQPFAAWSCTILSTFAVVILTVLALLFRANHESVMGSINDPEDGKAVSNTIFAAVFVYIGFLLCCGSQAFLNQRNGAVQLN